MYPKDHLRFAASHRHTKDKNLPHFKFLNSHFMTLDISFLFLKNPTIYCSKLIVLHRPVQILKNSPAGLMLGSPLAACTGSLCSICVQTLASAEEIKLMLLDELTFVSCSHVLLSLWRTQPATGQMPWAPHCQGVPTGITKSLVF